MFGLWLYDFTFVFSNGLLGTCLGDVLESSILFPELKTRFLAAFGACFASGGISDMLALYRPTFPSISLVILLVSWILL